MGHGGDAAHRRGGRGIFRRMDDTPMRCNREDSLNSRDFYAISAEENRLTLSNTYRDPSIRNGIITLEVS